MTVNTLGGDDISARKHGVSARKQGNSWLWPLAPIAVATFALSALVSYQLHADAGREAQSILQKLVVGIYSFVGFVPSFFFFLLVLSWSSIWFLTGKLDKPGGRLLRLLGLTVALAIWVNLRPAGSEPSPAAGALGGWIGGSMVAVFGHFLSVVLVAPFAFASLLLATDFFFYRFFEGFHARLDAFDGKPADGVEADVTEHFKGLSQVLAPTRLAGDARGRAAVAEVARASDEHDDAELVARAAAAAAAALAESATDDDADRAVGTAHDDEDDGAVDRRADRESDRAVRSDDDSDDFVLPRRESAFERRERLAREAAADSSVDESSDAESGLAESGDAESSDAAPGLAQASDVGPVEPTVAIEPPPRMHVRARLVEEDEFSIAAAIVDAEPVDAEPIATESTAAEPAAAEPTAAESAAAEQAAPTSVGAEAIGAGAAPESATDPIEPSGRRSLRRGWLAPIDDGDDPVLAAELKGNAVAASSPTPIEPAPSAAAMPIETAAPIAPAAPASDVAAMAFEPLRIEPVRVESLRIEPVASDARADESSAEPVGAEAESEPVEPESPAVEPVAAADDEPLVAIPRPPDGVRQQRLFVTTVDESLVREAVEIVTSTRRASIAQLQRKLRIDFEQAQEILAVLARRGVIDLVDGETQGRVR